MTAPRDPAPLTPEETLNNAYQERNAIVAALIRTNGWRCWVINATDAEGWYIVYAETPQGQVSWHVPSWDIALFADAKGAPLFDSAGPEWDGHSTDEKYRRLALLAAERAGAGRLRAALVEGVENLPIMFVEDAESEARMAVVSRYAVLRLLRPDILPALAEHTHEYVRRDGWWCSCGEPFRALDAEPGQPWPGEALEDEDPNDD